MPSNLFSGSFDWVSFLFDLFIRLIVVFTALPIHEYAHGLVAKKLGDPTASMQGRLNLNPFHHFDPIGTTCLLLTGFGWAKPVPVNPGYFKKPKQGMALTALAGPLSNLLLATALTLIFKVIAYFVPYNNFVVVLLSAISLMISINISLAVFNLLPIPPLDGAKIFGALLPDRIYWKVMQYERIIMIALFALLFATDILDLPISWLSGKIYTGIDFLTGFVDLIAQAVL